MSIVVAVGMWSLCSICLAADAAGKTVTYEYSGDVTTANRKTGVTTLDGNAWFRRSGGDYLNADKITMYKDIETGEIIRIESVGNVEMKEKEMSATCGHSIFYETEERIELKGSVDVPAVVDDGENRMEAPFIIYFRKEDRIYASGLLFSVGLEAKGDLENGTIPEGLRQEFKKNRILLSDDVTVSTEEADARWLITDGDKKYIVKKEDDKLDILASGSVQGHVTVEVKEEESEQNEQSN
jgi:lipopolysaccharide export system protein LptA